MANIIRTQYKRLAGVVGSITRSQPKKPVTEEQVHTHIAALCQFPDHEQCLLHSQANEDAKNKDIVEHIQELEKISAKNKYLCSLFTGLHTVCIILSNHAPIFATALFIITIIGFTLSPPIAIALAMGVVTGLLIAAIISSVLKKLEIDKMNKDIDLLKEQPEKLTDLRLQSLELKNQNDELRRKIASAGLNLSDIENEFKKKYGSRKTEVKLQEDEISIKPNRASQLLHPVATLFKKFYSNTRVGRIVKDRFDLFKANFKEKAPWLYSHASKTGVILLCIVEGVAGVGGALALAAIVMGVNVFQLSIVASFAAVTGMAGPLGIVFAIFLAFGIAGILVANKVLLDKPIAKQQDKIDYCKNQQRVEFAKVDGEIHKLQLENLYLENVLSKHPNIMNSPRPLVQLKDLTASKEQNLKSFSKPTGVSASNVIPAPAS